MADHDLVAELQGYRNELAHCEARGEDERGDAVRGEIERVRDAMREKAAGFERRAEVHEEIGQQVLAARAREDAARFRDMAGEDEPAKEPPKRGRGRPRKEDTSERSPKETA